MNKNFGFTSKYDYYINGSQNKIM